MGNALSVEGAHRNLVQKSTGLGHRSIGIVSRKKDPLSPHLEKKVEEGRYEVETTKGVVKVLTQVGANRALKLRDLRGEREVEPGQHKRKGFTHVTNDDLQTRVAV